MIKIYNTNGVLEGAYLKDKSTYELKQSDVDKILKNCTKRYLLLDVTEPVNDGIYNSLRDMDILRETILYGNIKGKLSILAIFCNKKKIAIALNSAQLMMD